MENTRIDMTKFRPIHDVILVERDKASEKTEGGIYIPDNAKEKLTKGIVIAVGRGKTLKDGRLQEPSVKPGDRVLFGKYSGNEVEQDGKSYVLMHEEDLYGVIGG